MDIAPASEAWVFDRKTDLKLFLILPLGIFVVLFFLKNAFDAGRFSQVLGLTSWIYLSAFDAPHAISTWYRFRSSNFEFLRMNRILFCIPPVLFLILLAGLHAFGFQMFRLITYANIFHFVRQQYGFLRISQAKAQHKDLPTAKTDQYFIYLFTLVPVALFHFDPTIVSEGQGWIFAKDLFTYPSLSIAAFLHGIFILGFAIYLQRLFRRKDWKKGPALLIMSTAVFWYLGASTNWIGDRTLLLDMIHVVAYLVIIYQFQMRRAGAAQKFSWKTVFIFYLPLLVLGLIWAQFFQWGLSNVSGSIEKAVLAFLGTVSLSHFIIDGFIWRFIPKNPDVLRYLKT